MHDAAEDEDRVPILLDLQQADENRRAENYDERIGKRAVTHRLLDGVLQLRVYSANDRQKRFMKIGN
jgi:hypothetical protein